MKKRYVGVVHITPEGDGVIEILSEENISPLNVVEQQKAIAALRSP